MIEPRFSTLYRIVLRYMENFRNCRSVQYAARNVEIDHYISLPDPPRSPTDHFQQALDITSFDMKEAERETIRVFKFEHHGLVYSAQTEVVVVDIESYRPTYRWDLTPSDSRRCQDCKDREFVRGPREPTGHLCSMLDHRILDPKKSVCGGWASVTGEEVEACNSGASG
jgi:hypothetical protein